LNRLIAMRSYQRMKRVEGVSIRCYRGCGITEEIAQICTVTWESPITKTLRYPNRPREERLDDAHGFQGHNGFSFGNASSTGISKVTLFRGAVWNP